MILLLYNTSKFIVGASLSEPHIDEMNVRNLYIIIIIIIIIESVDSISRDGPDTLIYIIHYKK